CWGRAPVPQSQAKAQKLALRCSVDAELAVAMHMAKARQDVAQSNFESSLLRQGGELSAYRSDHRVALCERPCYAGVHMGHSQFIVTGHDFTDLPARLPENFADKLPRIARTPFEVRERSWNR